MERVHQFHVPDVVEEGIYDFNAGVREVSNTDQMSTPEDTTRGEGSKPVDTLTTEEGRVIGMLLPCNLMRKLEKIPNRDEEMETQMRRLRR